MTGDRRNSGMRVKLEKANETSGGKKGRVTEGIQRDQEGRGGKRTDECRDEKNYCGGREGCKGGMNDRTG